MAVKFKPFIIVVFVLFIIGCSAPNSPEISGPPSVRVISASGEGQLNLLVAGMPLSVALSVERAGEVTCQRHEVKFAGAELVGYAPGAEGECGDEKIDLDWGALVATVIKIALKII